MEREKKSESEISFEQAFSHLEKILEKMNSGTLSLNDSLKTYEEAEKLIKCCAQRLNDAERKIETLVRNREGELQLSGENTPKVQPFETNEVR